MSPSALKTSLLLATGWGLLAGCDKVVPGAAVSGSYDEIATCYAEAIAVDALKEDVARTGKLHISEMFDLVYAAGKREGMTPTAVEADLRKRFNLIVEPLLKYEDIDEPGSGYPKLEAHAFKCAAEAAK